MQTEIINISPDEVPVPACNRSLSFRPFLQYIKDIKDKTNSHKKYFFTYVIEQFENHPEMLQEIPVEDVKQHGELLELVYNSLSRMVEDEEVNFWALSLPLEPTIFYSTNAFYNLISGVTHSQEFKKAHSVGTMQLEGNPTEFIYSVILKKYYGITAFFSRDMVHSLENHETGLTHYYKVNLDSRFISIHTEKELPEFTLEILQSGNYDKAERLRLVQEMLPLNMFSFEGFGIITITDVSVRYAVENIKGFILNNGMRSADNKFNDVIHWLKIIVENNAVEFGLLPTLYVNNKLVFNESLYVNSIIVNAARKYGMDESTYLQLLDRYFKNPKLIFYSEITEEEEEKHGYLKMLLANGINSYALIPIYFGTSLVGVLEVFGKEKTMLNEVMLSRLDPVIPLLSQLLKNGIHEFYNDVEEVIKKQFTSIQPSVQWKFNDVAWHYLRDEQTEGKAAEIKDIVFEEVYPLYGAVDIRNSTIERNYALNNDLKVQFTVLVDMLENLKKQSGFALLDEKIFLAKKWLEEISDLDKFNKHIAVNEFLEQNLMPFLDEFLESNAQWDHITKDYFDAVDEKNGVAYEHRLKLERSMNTVIGAVNNYLDKMQNEVQQAFPSYFEKFRTDGVEYDIYIGQSIAPEKHFSDIYLKNLRLLQLSSMASIAKLTASLCDQLPRKVQTTQLIFIHAQPIDIKFRRDEKRFDVEGAYNIRYHVVKKRIDKVCLKDKDERLTQPDKIALVYINQQDANEYLGYIEYLQGQQILCDDLEELELEELQGVNGLKALRVGVVLTNQEKPQLLQEALQEK